MARLLKPFVFLGFVLICFWIPGAYKRTTHGVRLAKCKLEWPAVVRWETAPLSPEREREIVAILEKPFSYFGKGTQSFVFLSQNGEYVLKLFHFHQCRIPLGKNLKNQWKKWTKGCEIEQFSLEESITRPFDSYKLAYDRAKDLAGLVYVHLNPKKTFLPMLRVRDRMGQSYQIDPAEYRFVLQKRADPFLSTLLKAKEAGSFDAHIQSLCALFQKLGDLGLANQDPIIARNFAFLNHQAVVIDAGSFLDDPTRAQADSHEFCVRLQRWIEKHF